MMTSIMLHRSAVLFGGHITYPGAALCENARRFSRSSS